MKKKNEKITFGSEANNAINNMSNLKSGGQTRGEISGLRIDTKGLSLGSNIKACSEGMSPLMQRFQRNKKKGDTKDQP